MIDWSLFRWAKGTPLALWRRQRDRHQARALRRCYARVDERDGWTCRFPGCLAAVAHHHHLVYRSHSKALLADPSNVIAICTLHHAWIHQYGWVRAEGDADYAVRWMLTFTGRRARCVLPFSSTTPQTNHLPVRLLDVARDTSRVPGSALSLGAQERKPMD